MDGNPTFLAISLDRWSNQQYDMSHKPRTMTETPKRKSRGLNALVWEAQPRWAQIAQAGIIFPAIIMMVFTVIFDPDNKHRLVSYPVALLVVAASMQVFFFVRASLNGDI